MIFNYNIIITQNLWMTVCYFPFDLVGNIQSRPEGISLGYCPKYDGLQGKIDDVSDMKFCCKSY